MTIANCVDFFVSVCVLLSENPAVQDGWAVIMHALGRSPYALGQKMTHYTYCMTAIYYHKFFCARAGMKRARQVFFDFQRVDIKHAYRVSHIYLACLSFYNYDI